MRAIQNYLPHPHHTETMRIFVHAQPEIAWNLARHYDMSSVSWVHFLFNLRTIADIFHRDKPVHHDTRIGLDQIAANGKGFMIIHEIRGKEVVVGAIGKFWHVDIPFKEMHPEDFRSFNDPGWGKLAWSLTVEPYLTGSTICFELRTTATDHDSWKKLNLYYHIIGTFSKLIRHSLMNHLEKELGGLTFPDDSTRYLPGDELIPNTKYSDTDNVNMEAPVSIVWSYLMRLGCDRAGWYSID
ncbi:MAG TPA: SRPBCC family protein, partial [Chitinophagaceae bacterium]